MTNTVSRQVRRSQERLAKKPLPGPISRTSPRHMARKTKGMPYSTMIITSITESKSGLPVVFNLKSPTRNKYHKIVATVNNIEWFIGGTTESMRMSLLGQY
jgi:hypothetical protein